MKIIKPSEDSSLLVTILCSKKEYEILQDGLTARLNIKGAELADSTRPMEMVELADTIYSTSRMYQEMEEVYQ